MLLEKLSGVTESTGLEEIRKIGLLGHVVIL
jgi:hypothetical protein